MDWIKTLWSQSSWTEWHCSHKQSSWTEWCCGHKQTVHGLNYDTAVTNRLFMDWMTLVTQTDCSWTEWWHCNQKQTVHGLTNTAGTSDFMDWLTLLTQTAHGLNDDTAVKTYCSWTDQCSSHIRLNGLNDVSQADSFNNSQNLRPKVLTTVLLRIQVFCDVRLCGWVRGSWNIKVSEYLHNIRNRAPNHTVSHPRIPEPSIHINSCTSFPRKLESTTFSGIIFCFCWVPYSLTSCILITCYHPSSTETTTC